MPHQPLNPYTHAKEAHFGFEVDIELTLPSVSVKALDGDGEWFFQEWQAEPILEEAKIVVEAIENCSMCQAVAYMAMNW